MCLQDDVEREIARKKPSKSMINQRSINDQSTMADDTPPTRLLFALPKYHLAC